MRLTVIGCSDAFASGGRYHSCYLLDTAQGRLMLDCGANSTLALKRAGIALASIDAIVISHCHGDHFGGVPFLFLERMFIERGPKPVEVLGPPGIARARPIFLKRSIPRFPVFPRISKFATASSNPVTQAHGEAFRYQPTKSFISPALPR